MRELEANLADEAPAIGVHLDEDDAAEAVMGAHHIAAVDEVGIADHPVAMKTQGMSEAHTVDSGAVLETLMTHPATMVVAITVPRLRRGGADTGGGKHRQRRCREDGFHARHGHLLE